MSNGVSISINNFTLNFLSSMVDQGIAVNRSRAAFLIVLGGFEPEEGGGKSGEYCRRYYVERMLKESAKALFLLESLQPPEKNSEIREEVLKELRALGEPCKFGHNIGESFEETPNNFEVSSRKCHTIFLYFLEGSGAREKLESLYKSSGTVLTFSQWLGHEVIKGCSRRYNNLITEQEIRIITVTHLATINKHLAKHVKLKEMSQESKKTELEKLENFYKYYSIL